MIAFCQGCQTCLPVRLIPYVKLLLHHLYISFGYTWAGARVILAVYYGMLFTIMIPIRLLPYVKLLLHDLYISIGYTWAGARVILAVCYGMLLTSMMISIALPFLPEASFGLRVLSWPLSVYLSVCVYQSLACPHDDSSAVQARIT